MDLRDALLRQLHAILGQFKGKRGISISPARNDHRRVANLTRAFLLATSGGNRCRRKNGDRQGFFCFACTNYPIVQDGSTYSSSRSNRNRRIYMAAFVHDCSRFVCKLAGSQLQEYLRNVAGTAEAGTERSAAVPSPRRADAPGAVINAGINGGLRSMARVPTPAPTATVSDEPPRRVGAKPGEGAPQVGAGLDRQWQQSAVAVGHFGHFRTTKRPRHAARRHFRRKRRPKCPR
jgi:hypothetical protein